MIKILNLCLIKPTRIFFLYFECSNFSKSCRFCNQEWKNIVDIDLSIVLRKWDFSNKNKKYIFIVLSRILIMTDIFALSTFFTIVVSLHFPGSVMDSNHETVAAWCEAEKSGTLCPLLARGVWIDTLWNAHEGHCLQKIHP